MCKFTTIILLFGMFLISTTEIKAQNADFEFLKKINNIDQTVGLSRFVSNSTTATVISVPATLAVVAFVTNDDDLLKSALYITTSLGVNTVLTYSLKYSINRVRPYDVYPTEITAYSVESSASFPSGHTSLAFATATSLSLKFPEWYVVAPSYIWAGYVGYSRMNLGVHYPTDVLAGAVLGAGSAFLTYKINEWYWKKRDNKKLLVLNNYL